MENKEIVKKLKLVSTLLDLHDENEFKSRSYSIGAYRLEKIPEPLAAMSVQEIEKIEGIGKSIATSVFTIAREGTFTQLDELLNNTPDSVLSLLDISGVGPKKIGVIWRELGIENADDLMQACKEGAIAKLKGFGDKMQSKIIEGLLYLKKNEKFQYIDKAEVPLLALEESLQALLPEAMVSIAGQVRRRTETVDLAELVIGIDNRTKLKSILDEHEAIDLDMKISGPFCFRGKLLPANLDLAIWLSDKKGFYSTLLKKTGSKAHLATDFKADKPFIHTLNSASFESEEAAFAAVDMPYIDPELREGYLEKKLSSMGAMPQLLVDDDLKGTVHNHSNYSDGRHTLRQMAEAARDQGYQYLGISDHSKTAVYANGLDEERIVKQHLEIDELNKELAPFRIFKGIESDILQDGSLDYEDNVLASFDFIVASIHAQMNMDEKKATERLIKAVSNPYTTILGHLTGRVLLKRDGYPIDHRAVIDACAEHNVIVEINANPYRLDLDWRWVHYALEKNVTLSVNPDAHDMNHYAFQHYGVGIGRKGGLTKKMTFNAKSVDQVDDYLTLRKSKIKQKV